MIVKSISRKLLALKPRTALAWICFAGMLARLFVAFYQGDAIRELPGVYDQLSYHTLALQVVSTHTFTFPSAWWPMTRPGEPTAHWSFLYTLYLTAAYLLFGPHPLIPRVLQAMVSGVLHPWLSWRIGRRLFGSATGLASAAISSIYSYHVFYAGSLMTETFYIIAILWAIDLVLSLSDTSLDSRDTRHLWWLLGLAFGTAVLLRQLIIFLIPVMMGWLWWTLKSQSFRSKLMGSLSTLAVVVAMIIPWTVRNYYAFGKFVLLNTNAGFAFYWANHPIHGREFIPILPADGPSYGELIPTGLRTLDEASLDRALLREGIGIVIRDPKRYLELSLGRAREYFKFWPSADSSLPSNVARLASVAWFLPLAILGIGTDMTRARKAPVSGQEGSVLLYLFAGTYTVMHLLSWALIRYRLPVDAVMTPIAALGLCALAGRFTKEPTYLHWWGGQRKIVAAPKSRQSLHATINRIQE
jgi:4-amino-4-deoxy-L-arabinose transferase-like glycosyltransferase